jgi:O-antigen ligase
MRIAFLFLAYFLLNTGKKVMWALGLFIAFSFVPALYTLYASLNYGWGFQRTSLLINEIGFGSRYLEWSILYSANQGGTAAVLLLGLYPFAQKWRYRFAILSLSLFLFLMAFATQYRREMLITPVIILLYLLIDKTRGLRGPAIIMAGVGAAIFFLAILPSLVFQQRLEETRYIISGTESRIVSARAGFYAFMESPLLGHGPSSYQTAVAPHAGWSRWAKSPYNVFIWISVEAGIFGLAGLILILTGIYRQGKKLREGLPMAETWALRCTPILVVLFVAWFSFGNNWDLSQPWYLMGVILAASRLTEQQRERTKI